MDKQLAKEAICFELKEKLEMLDKLPQMKGATIRDYRRLENRINELCLMLDQIEKGDK